MKKNALGLAAVAAALVFCLAGCGGSGAPSSQGTASGSSEIASSASAATATVDDAVEMFKAKDRAGAVKTLEAIEAAGTPLNEYGPVNITAMYAYDPESDPNYKSFTDEKNYNVYVFGELKSDELADTSFSYFAEGPGYSGGSRHSASMISVEMNAVNDYTDSTDWNRENSDIKAITDKGYKYLAQTTGTLQGGADPMKFFARLSLSQNDVDFENGIIAFNIDFLKVGDEDLSKDNAIVMPVTRIQHLGSVEERDAMLASL